MIGFHASHEQIPPAELLRAVQRAEEVGFQAAMCSDHLAPWSERQGESGFAWAWLGAALQSTGLSFGVVNAPGQRYHPAIIAQAIATLGSLYPGRFWAALGSGEALNEHVTGDPWPRKELRNRRLEECVDIIRRLLAGETVTHDGLVTVDRARIWSLPEQTPALIAPAVSPQTAARMAAWADGLITIAQPDDALRGMLDAYRDAGGRGPAVLQVHLSWAPTDDEAEAIAIDQWRTNAFRPPVPWDTATVEEFDEIGRYVRPEDLSASVLVSSDTSLHAGRIAHWLELGFDDVYLHHVGQRQDAFLDAFGDRVLPQLIPAAGGHA